MSFAFDETRQRQFDALKPRYPQLKALTLPTLWLAQEQQGYLDAEALEYVADRLELPLSHIYGVATFYTMFRMTPPPAKISIEVCRTLSCALMGGEELSDFIAKRYGISIGEISEDGTVELLEAECLGACGGAPMCAINGVYHENLTPESLEALLKEHGC